MRVASAASACSAGASPSAVACAAVSSAVEARSLGGERFGGVVARDGAGRGERDVQSRDSLLSVHPLARRLLVVLLSLPLLVGERGRRRVGIEGRGAGVRRGRMLGRSADRARLSRSQAGRQLGGHAGETALAQVEPGGVGVLLAVDGGAAVLVRPLELRGEGVALGGLVGALAGGLGLGRQAPRSGGGVARGGDGGIEGGAFVGGLLDGRSRRLSPGHGLVRRALQRRQLRVGLGQPRFDRHERVERTGLAAGLRRPGAQVGGGGVPLWVGYGDTKGHRSVEQRRERRGAAGGGELRFGLVAGGAAGLPDGQLLDGLGVAGAALRALAALGEGALGRSARGARRAAGGAGAHELRLGAHAEAGGPLGVQVGILGRVLAGGLGHAREDLVHALPGCLQLRVCGLAPVVEPVLDAREAVGAEEAFEHRLALAAVCPQERRELALGQEHDLAELVARHPEQGVELAARLVGTRGQGDPLVAGGLQLLNGARRRILGDALAAQLRPLLRRPPHDPQPPPAQRDLQLDLRAHARIGVVRAQASVARSRARHLPVEREADRVEQGGLARARVAVQQEEAGLAQGVEVDLLAGGERLEGGEAQAVQAHGLAYAASSATRRAVSASRSSASSSSAAARPRVSATKRCTSSSSSSPRRRW